jgi:D-alanyl-D-alanine carboxypeptidase (penicillin-binding protein 5/6)
MSAVPRRSARRRRLVLVGAAAATALLGLSTPASAHPATPSAHPATRKRQGPAATASARPVPGVDATQPCYSAVAYSVGGKTRPARPLPRTASTVGGDRLAAAGLQVSPSAGRRPPAPRATAWLVADLDSGRVLAACNAHVPLAPASSLKVLTALALTPKVAPGARYVARNEDARVDGTRVGLVPGSVYTAKDLWHALLMGSANDAATGLAAMAGGTASATSMMNDTARALGAADTRAVNTSGLDEPGQVSSAYDLALFGRAALADPEIMKYARTRSYPFPEAGTAAVGRGRKTFQIQNHDKLLYNYPGALGIKNGWTSTSGGSFIGASQRGGRRIIATVLAADPQTWRMSAALMDWAYSATDPAAQGVGELVGPSADGVQASGPTATGPSGASGAGRRTAGVDAGTVTPVTGTGLTEPVMSAGMFLGLVAGGVAVAAAGTVLVRRRARARPADDSLVDVSADGASADDGCWQRRRTFL